MDSQQLQELCATGQEQLMRMDYIRAEKTLLQAEITANQLNDFDTLSRLYMPLQETRRQRRQRCGEGVVRLDLIDLDPEKVLHDFPHGQLLLAGIGSIEPALKLRQLQFERELYVETFLAAAYEIGASRAIMIVPLADVQLPKNVSSIDDLIRLAPPHSIVMNESELPRGDRRGTTKTFAEIMATWERLHTPFLAAADAEKDLLRKIDGYRKTIRVDYACELAHQKLSEAARQISRRKS